MTVPPLVSLNVSNCAPRGIVPHVTLRVSLRPVRVCCRVVLVVRVQFTIMLRRCFLRPLLINIVRIDLFGMSAARLIKLLLIVMFAMSTGVSV